MPTPKPPTKSFEQDAKERFDRIAKPEISFDQFLDFERIQIERFAQLAENPAQKFAPTPVAGATTCGNGDLDASLDKSQWNGASGSVFRYDDPSQPSPNEPNPATLVTGILSDSNIFSSAGHQTWVSSGTDPIVPIPTTAQGSPGAVRVGNAVNGFGSEILSKTFTVTSAKPLIKFWYAVVLQNPVGHPIEDQPFFWVRITDSNGVLIPGAVNLGVGSDRLVADANNPFFQQQKGTQGDSTLILYKDWACAQINLSSHVGKVVNVEFITGDCAQGGHWGYAYIDNFCGTCDGSPEGTLTFDAAETSKCGTGIICFNYTLPKDPKGNTGSVLITLDIYQDGALMSQLVSPVLTSGNKHCFRVKPGGLGLNPDLEGFDFVATGNFTINGPNGPISLAPMSVGSAPGGFTPGLNNDYQVACKTFSYSVKFVCGTEGECGCGCGPVRPGSYATEINIYNPNPVEAQIQKHIVPVVLAGAAVGREPRVGTRRANDKMALPPRSATMDDCCRIMELLLGAPPQGPSPLTVGFLEIESPVELKVTAVYTMTGANGGVSIDVEQIAGQVIRT